MPDKSNHVSINICGLGFATPTLRILISRETLGTVDKSRPRVTAHLFDGFLFSQERQHDGFTMSKFEFVSNFEFSA